MGVLSVGRVEELICHVYSSREEAKMLKTSKPTLRFPLYRARLMISAAQLRESSRNNT